MLGALNSSESTYFVDNANVLYAFKYYLTQPNEPCNMDGRPD